MKAIDALRDIPCKFSKKDGIYYRCSCEYFGKFKKGVISVNIFTILCTTKDWNQCVLNPEVNPKVAE